MQTIVTIIIKKSLLESQKISGSLMARKDHRTKQKYPQC